MQSRTMPAICLGPMGNMQGTYNFLNLAMGHIVKCRRFHEIPAPDLVIKRINDLATKNGVSSTLVFANQHKIPYDWPDNDAHQDGLDPTPLAPYPDIPAKIPGVTLERHVPPSPPLLQQSSLDHDWSHLADEAIVNVDLNFEEHLPSPPVVIEIAEKDELNYSPLSLYFPWPNQNCRCHRKLTPIFHWHLHNICFAVPPVFVALLNICKIICLRQ
jgi:hypothetical protein